MDAPDERAPEGLGLDFQKSSGRWILWLHPLVGRKVGICLIRRLHVCCHSTNCGLTRTYISLLTIARRQISLDMSHPFKINLRVILAVLSSLLLGLPSFAAEGGTLKILTGVIVEVSSGDTVLLRTANNREFTIGVWGVDSPENNNKVGQRARKYTAKLVEGESVEVRVKARTSDGRILARILFKGDRDLAEELLKQGYAVWVTGLAPDEADYSVAQEVAQEDRRGIWKAWLPKKGL